MKGENAMENKKGSLSTVFLIIAIILIGVMGVFMYMQKTEADRQIAELENNGSKMEETISNLQGKIDSISNTINANDETNVEQEVVMTANERYSTYINGLKNNLNKIQENSHISVNSGEHMTLSNAGINSYITIENNGDAYLGLEKDGKLGKKYGEKYKVATKIVNAGIQVYGQDASVLLWFINELGEFSYIDISDVNIENLEIKTIKDLKNIVDVTIKYNGEANIPVAIDIEGNLLEVKF
jgi:preprotein translocase subunit YajC